MLAPEKQQPMTLNEAATQLERYSHHPVRARVGDLDLEIRVIGNEAEAHAGLGD